MKQFRRYQQIIFQMGFAPVIVLIAFAMRLYLLQFTGKGAPYIFFFGAVLLCSFIVGPVSGVIALVFSAPLATYYFVWQSGYGLSESLFQGSLYCIEGIIVIFSARITERNARETRQLSKLHEALIAIVSHDLKSPLTSILLNSDMIMRSSSEGQPNFLRAEKIRSSVKKMKSLIDSLLDFSAIESGKLVLSPQSCPAESIIDEVTEMLEPIARLKLIDLEKQVGDIPHIQCDRIRVNQILTNLVSNAIKFTPEKGKIVISAKKQNEYEILFEVCDSGPGVPDNEQPHIFDRYWQSEKTRSQGNGLGLSIAKGMVDAHHGRIWVKNNAHHGCTFSFTLPVKLKENLRYLPGPIDSRPKI